MNGWTKKGKGDWREIGQGLTGGECEKAGWKFPHQPTYYKSNDLYLRLDYFS